MGQPNPRANLERSLFEVPKELRRYRSWLRRFSLRALGLGVAVVAGGALFKLPMVAYVGLVVTMSMAFVLPFAFLVEKFGSRRRLDVSVKQFVLDDGRGEVQTYALEKIEHVRLTWIPYLFARLRIHMVDGRVLSLAPRWDRFDYVLDLLHHAQPELTSFARYDRFRIHCIASDHRRTRNAEAAKPRNVAWLISKFMIAPLFATVFIMALRSVGLGTGVFPAMREVVNDAFFASMVLWALVGTFEEATLHRAQVKKLLTDPKQVRRDILGEKKFRHTFGIESWMAFWTVLVLTCLVGAFGLS